eukprot:4546712-Pyramimonas_sp.AAC.1
MELHTQARNVSLARRARQNVGQRVPNQHAERVRYRRLEHGACCVPARAYQGSQSDALLFSAEPPPCD